MTFDDLQRFNRGVYRIDHRDFDRVLAETIGASREYSSRCFSRFRDNPVGYIMTRNPDIQGRKLFELAMEKGKEN